MIDELTKRFKVLTREDPDWPADLPLLATNWEAVVFDVERGDIAVFASLADADLFRDIQINRAVTEAIRHREGRP